MPSPIAHSSIALLLYPLLRPAFPATLSLQRRAVIFGSVVFATLAPDLDFLVELARGRDPIAGHGTYSHSILATLIFALLFAGAMRLLGARGFLRTATVGALAYGSHLLLDMGNFGRGIALLWPFAGERLSLPFTIFYGVRHSEWREFHHHFVTLANELGFVFLIAVIAYLLLRRRTPAPFPPAPGARVP